MGTPNSAYPKTKLIFQNLNLHEVLFAICEILEEVTAFSSGKLDDNTFPIGLNGLIISMMYV